MVWETNRIPIPVGAKVVSIMVTCALDASATGTNGEILQETDVHNGSEDGYGEFNWRMKFPLIVPCNFPRLRIQVSNFSAFGTNEMIGEQVISLKK